MAVRSRVLLPDVAVRTVNGEMEVVSREQLESVVADALALQDMAGGYVTVGVQRMPTGAPNEMVTVSAMVEWKDRSDAKAQPEPKADPDLDVAEAIQQDAEPVLAAGEPDGLDLSSLEDEDLSEVPEHAR